ncbi:hypothetical protein F1C58_09765 [Glaciihabitans sp. INWT7]|uniref:DUF5652 family protein n=1 Tax=Glaciihabitans sp. INWT7 TaxID=2596912 RepID=UPI001628C035|nr:DUF5652 family protein [Glaciihabitans sp. INWT7]QNE47156.1 hypothetical protein F1C58_09765 [Glaciihabitans sp. INWT7]
MDYKRPEPAQLALISLLAAWTLAWKGASLWHAAKDDSKPWFVALLLSNTAGLLDALYIFRVSRTRELAVEDARSDDSYPQQTHTVED